MAYPASIQAVLDKTIPELAIHFDGISAENGAYLARKAAGSKPTFSYTNLNTSKTYTVTMVDLDAPFINLPVLSPLLHYLLPDLTASAAGSLSSTTAPLADYLPPTPPPGAAPHRYVSLLYEQPQEFNSDESVAPKQGLSMYSRIRLDFDGLEKRAKFGKPIAGCYFTSN